MQGKEQNRDAANKQYTPEEIMQEIQRLSALLQKQDLTEAEYLKEKQKLINMMK